MNKEGREILPSLLKKSAVFTLLMLSSVYLFPQEKKENMQKKYIGYNDKNNDGINDLFQDANGDGINDLKPYFEDKDGDGINDNAIDVDKDGINDITGKPTTKQDELFIDEDGDGINDLYLLKEGKDFKFKYYEKGIKRFKRYRIEKKRKGESK